MTEQRPAAGAVIACGRIERLRSRLVLHAPLEALRGAVAAQIEAHCGDVAFVAHAYRLDSVCVVVLPADFKERTNLGLGDEAEIILGRPRERVDRSGDYSTRAERQSRLLIAESRTASIRIARLDAARGS